MRPSSRRVLPWLGLIAATLLAGGEATATDAPIAVGEVSPPPPGSGIDPAEIRHAAEGAIRQLDATQIRDRRRTIVSFAVTQAEVEGPVACTINATVRDARTGAMIGVIEASAHANAPGSAQVRRQVTEGAVRRAVHRIPSVLGAK